MNSYEALCHKIKQMFSFARDTLKVNEQNGSELPWEYFTAKLCEKHQANLVSSKRGCHHHEIKIPFEKDYELLLKEKKGKASVPLYFVFSQYNIKFTLAEIKLCEENISVISLFLQQFSKMKNIPSFDSTVQNILENEMSFREKQSEDAHEADLQWLRKVMPEYYGKKEKCDGVENKNNEQLMLHYIKQYIDEKITERVNEIFAQIAAASQNANRWLGL